MIEITTPIGRAVQGAVVLREERDDDNKVKRDDNGQPKMSFFMALAIAKDNPEWDAFYGALYNEARASFPGLVQNGVINHPAFSFKIIDGDGVDANGKQNNTKTGFAGHWIIRLTTQFVPAFFHTGRYDAMAQVQDVPKSCKIGDYFRARVTIKGNGWKPGDQSKPGVYVNPTLISIEGFGEAINNAPDANEAFNQQATYRPAGMSQTPVGGTSGGSLPPPPGGSSGGGLPPPPGTQQGAAGGLPPPPGAGGAGAGLPPPPGASGGAGLPPPPGNRGPQYEMTAAAQGATREALIGIGWSEADLIAQGLMVKHY